MRLMKNLTGGTRSIVFGLIAGLSGLLVFALLAVILTAYSYNGRCGGLLPFMGGSRECGLWEYMSEQLPFTFEVMLDEYRYFLAAVLLAPPVIMRIYYWYLTRRAGGTNN